MLIANVVLSVVRQKPVRTFNEHKKEVCSVDWCQNSTDDFLLSASWDCSVKIVSE